MIVACGSAGPAGGVPSGGSGSGPTPSPAASAPAVVTEADAGRTFQLRTGDQVHLRLSNRYLWTEPAVSGRISLTPVEYFRDPGYREWTIAVAGPGRATITSTGSPNCPSGGGSLAFSVTFVAS